MDRLLIVPLTLRQANALIAALHRHHGPVVGHRWSIGVQTPDGTLRGAAIAGRPVARLLDDGQTVEIVRVATDGTANACSCLYGAARRIARAMGYRRVITYTLASEPGTSLIAAGWRLAANGPGGSWDRPSRRRRDDHPLDAKCRWEAP